MKKVDEIYEELLGRILSDELVSGSRLLPERELAQECGTNRNTLREAIRRLEQVGLLSVRQGQGATVLDFRKSGSLELIGPYLQYGSNPNEKARVLLDLLPARRQMFEFLVVMAVRSATPEDLKRLEQATALTAKAEDARDTVGLISAHHEWLEVLVEAGHSLPLRWSANPLLSALRQILERISSLVYFEPSYTSYATDVYTSIALRDTEGAIARSNRFFDEQDLRVRAILADMMLESLKDKGLGTRTNLLDESTK